MTRRKSVATAASSGDRLELLIAMRRRIAEAVTDPECPPRDLAALTRRLQEISKDIDEIEERQGKEKQSHDSNANNGAVPWNVHV